MFLPPPTTTRRQSAFTLVEVMVAALMLVVAMVGMIEAVTISSKMMDTARRQTLASEIINHEIDQLRLQSWTAINALPATQTIGAAWNSGTTYAVGDTVTRSGVWYRSIVAGAAHTPSAASTYWSVDTPPYANVMDTSGFALGATYTLTRAATDAVSGSLREVTFTVTWVVATSRLNADGTLFTFTYTRVNTAYFGKYGLNLTYQRS